MMAELSNFINYQLVNVQKLVERITKTQENSLSPASIELSFSRIYFFYKCGLSPYLGQFWECIGRFESYNMSQTHIENFPIGTALVCPTSIYCSWSNVSYIPANRYFCYRWKMERFGIALFWYVCIKKPKYLNFQHLFRYQQLDSEIWSRWWSPRWCMQMLSEMNQVRFHLLKYTRLLNSRVSGLFCRTNDPLICPYLLLVG